MIVHDLCPLFTVVVFTAPFFACGIFDGDVKAHDLEMALAVIAGFFLRLARIDVDAVQLAPDLFSGIGVRRRGPHGGAAPAAP